MSAVRFRAELILGHKGVTCVLVPFDPEQRWGLKPYRLAGRRHGWPVRGTCAGCTFTGYVGERWGRRFVVIEAALRRAAGIAVGDEVALSLAPSDDPATIARAIEQSRVTTQPAQARADARLAKLLERSALASPADAEAMLARAEKAQAMAKKEVATDRGQAWAAGTKATKVAVE